MTEDWVVFVVVVLLLIILYIFINETFEGKLDAWFDKVFNDFFGGNEK